MPGRGSTKWLHAWPGLYRLWVEGAWWGLAWALGFGLLLNGLLVASLVWTAWIAPSVRYGAWGIVVSVWFATACIGLMVHGTGRNRRNVPACGSPGHATEFAEKPAEDLFGPFHAQYLQGRWLEAESLLREMMDLDPLDADAVLMWATLCRHTGRMQEAETLLRRVEQIDEQAKWSLEISRERSVLKTLREKQGDTAGRGAAVGTDRGGELPESLDRRRTGSMSQDAGARGA